MSKTVLSMLLLSLIKGINDRLTRAYKGFSNKMELNMQLDTYLEIIKLGDDK